ncbi:MAG TPA: hypothetical protein VI451_11525, partial [Anaerolineales bacterium]|nr:hypothetical protein [Anaerolineales bacterium]
EIDTPTPTSTATHTATPTPPPQPQITSPSGGDAVQGQVSISGASGVPGFFYYELTFAYTGDTTGTWFLIEESFNPIQSGALATWDTFAITDGTYDLRLLVTLIDASQMETVVRGVRVRNYTLIETSTPTPSLTPTSAPTTDQTRTFTPPDTLTITPTPTGTPPAPTVTSLPRNPAEIVPQQISDSLLRGAAGTLAAFLLLGMYSSLRRRRR